MTRKFIYFIFIIILVSLVGCTTSSDEPLRVGTIPWPGYESIHLAQSLNYAEMEKIRIIEQANATQTSRAIRNGMIDAAMLTMDEVLNLLQDSEDLHIVLVMDVSNGADVVIAKPEIHNLSALVGKRIGVENAAVGAVMLDALLTAAGLKMTDIQLVPIPVNEHVTAYQNGKLDAVVTFEPARTELLDQGAKILFDSSRIPGRIVDVLVVRADALVKHRQHILELVAAHFKALDYLGKQPQDAAARIAPFLGVNEDQVLPQFNGLILPDLAENRVQLGGSEFKLFKAIVELRDLMLKQKLLQRSMALDQVIDHSFLPTVAK